MASTRRSLRKLTQETPLRSIRSAWNMRMGKWCLKTFPKPSCGMERPQSRAIQSAQAHLGIAYYNGQGVPQDYAQAATWSRKAAEQGDAGATLGAMGGKQTAKRGSEYFRQIAAKRKTHAGGGHRKNLSQIELELLGGGREN
jgi:TPR repeat protein